MDAARRAWIGGSVVLAVLTVAVVLADGPLPGEVGFILWLQEFGTPVPEFAEFVRATTGTEGNLVVGIVPAVWVIRRHGRRGIACVLICLTSMLVVQPVTKGLIDRDRPTADQVEVRAEHSSKSYPSGHSLSTTTVWGCAAVLTWRARRRAAAALLTAPIVATGFASGIQGVHWASDAVAGTLIGAGAAALAARQLLPPLRPDDAFAAVEH